MAMYNGVTECKSNNIIDGATNFGLKYCDRQRRASTRQKYFTKKYNIQTVLCIKQKSGRTPSRKTELP